VKKVSKPLRILIVEDSENDALLLVRQLRRDGFEPEFKQVDTPSSMAAALDTKTWDLIVADYSLPHFSGLAALEVLKKTGADVPFILVSGSIGEDVAVEAMKAGAHDYIMKGNFRRLIPSIERELREAEIRREHRRAETKVKQHSERLQALHDIDLAITSTLDLQAVLKVLLEKIDLVLPYSATTVRLFNRETQELESVACRNLNEIDWKSMGGKGVHGLAKIVLERKIPLTVSNVQTDSRVTASNFARKEGLISYIGVPLIVRGEALGLIAFYTRESHSFSDDEIEFLTTLAGQAAVAIYNSQLYESVSLSKRELELTNLRLEKSLKELSAFHTALGPLMPSESIQELMNGVLDRLLEATGADAGLIRINDQEHTSYPIAGQRGFPDYYIQRVELAPIGGAAEWVIQHGEPIIAPDIAADPRLKGKVQLAIGFHSCAMLPLMVHNDPSGLIHLASKKLRYFADEQRDHLMAIARQMSIALENRKLYDILRHSNDELAKANKVKSEFLGVMSHELRTPLNIMMGFVRLLQDKYLGDINSRQEDSLTKIANQADALLTMISSIMDATKIESGEVMLENTEFNVAALIEELKDACVMPLRKELTVVWECASGLPIVTMDRSKLKTILQNLINNAIKFTDSGRVTVSVRMKMSDGSPALSTSDRSRSLKHIECVVTDTGIGIAEENLPIIFDMFRQMDGSDTRLYGGVGLGLYIVKKLTGLLGGRIEVNSKLGQGSIFTVILPFGQS
jgi:signal transduction histidine kinase/DNA-binding response OmpR family regulator